MINMRLSFLLILCIAGSAFSANAQVAPTFTGGAVQTFVVCQNSGANSINALLTINDADVSETETWSTLSGALHGSLTASYSATSTGGSITPAGLSYTPTFGYTGTDSFSIIISDGTFSDTTKIRVTVNPLPVAGTITGLSAVCVGSFITLANGIGGGVWSRSNTHATVSTLGVVAGVSAGIDTIYYTVSNGCGSAVASKTVTVNPLPTVGVISGSSLSCIGIPATLTNSVPGGVWSSSNGTATITSGGVVTGVMSGRDTIMYAVTNSCGSAIATKTIDVLPVLLSGTISGATALCEGDSITLTTTGSLGGVWSASNGSATVSAGMVTAIYAGIDTISYTVSNACGTSSATAVITINPLAVVGPITGASGLCVGAGIILSESAPGGVWSSTSGSTSVDMMGVVTGIFPGPDSILYTVTTACGTAIATTTVMVNPVPYAGIISGGSGVCAGSVLPLTTDGDAGGVWYSSNFTSALISTTGLVTGMSPGTSDISYVVTNTCGTDTAITTISTDLPAMPIICDSTVCPFSYLILLNFSTGGTWSTTDPLVAFAFDGTMLGFPGGVAFGLTSGKTTVTYTLNNGCGITTATKEIRVMTAEECDTTSTIDSNVATWNVTGANEELKVYPNPNNGNFSLDVVAHLNEIAHVTITNIIGQKVKEFNTTTNTISDVTVGPQPGIYFITVATVHNRYTAKVTVQ